MRIVEAEKITSLVEKLCIEACCVITDDIYSCFKNCIKTEKSALGREILGTLVENADIARNEQSPICQDTGMTIVFVEIGQDLHITGGLLEDAINEGIAKGYTEGYLRKSVVAEPLFNRKNTQNNTPGVIYTKVVAGDKLSITIAPKGFGSENKSGVKMLVPADGVEGVKKAVMEIVQHAGPNPCPPEVVGVGIGGTMDQAALLSKKALTRPIDQRHAMPEYAKLESELLEMINKTGIGPQLGGTTTALAVNVEWGATHIAGLPVAVTICCHALRHAHRVL